jgi:putative phage-type endonuclease
MSFGNLNLMLNKTIEQLETTIKKDSLINLLDCSIYKKQIFNHLHTDFPEVTTDIVDEIFSRLFLTNYKFVNNICFENGKNCFREYENEYPNIKVPSKYKKLNEHFEKLKNLPQPAQRSQEWYDYRYNRITASDTAAAIDLNPYEPVESFILKKCDPNFPFRDNATVFHGKKYEPIATMIYEHIYNTRVFEFGALPSEKYAILGASPDGICSKFTLDNKFSDRLGTMLEIKCPVTREIHTHGNIMGDICPFYYYCQVQQQLACCELNVCDFWQCKLSEYKTRDEYLSDTCNSCNNTVGTNSEKINVDNKLKKGVILEFYPKNFIPEFDGDLAEWKSKYIIPKRLDMNESQYDNWIIKTMDQYKTQYPEISANYYFYRIIYWKLESSHNVSIKRDDTFLSNIIPIMNETWNKILYYRTHQDKLKELQVITDRRKKYIRFNTNFKINNKQIISGKHLFLDKSFNLNTIINNQSNKSNTNFTKISKQVSKDYDSDYGDFIDNKECDFIDDDDKPVKNNTKSLLIQNKVNNNNEECDFIDEDNKPLKNNKPVKNNTKSLLIQNKVNNNDNNEECDFIDDDDKPVKNNTKSLLIQNKVNNKKVKPTEFLNKKVNKKNVNNNYTDNDCNFIDD